MTTQKNKRLSQGDRDAILRFASKQIKASEDRTNLDAAYELAATAIHAVIIEKAPQKDMAVLARYDCAALDRCIYISTGGYNYDRFEYNEGDRRIVLRPTKSNCNRNAILLSGEAEKAYDAYRAAKKVYEIALSKRLSDFSALISGTPSFNALAEVWPAVEAMREKIVGSSTALAVLSSEVIDRIKADPALTMAEAAQ